jgi:beta-glucosidase
MKNILLVILICSVTTAQNKNIDGRVDSVLSKMTLEEKIGQLNQYTAGWNTGTSTAKAKNSNEEIVKQGKIGSFLNIIGVENTKRLQKIAVEESRTKIPLLFGLDVIHGYKTTFPTPLAEASSWDVKAVEKSARWQAIEASSAGIHWTFNPMVDIARDPRWGRITEGSGEDPYLGSLMSAARVKGYQGDNLSSENTIAACVKHFAGYGGAEGGRDYNTVDISERTFRDVYLRPYKAAVDAGVVTVMTSFNEIGGIPSSSNKNLLTKILRDEWKFKGFIVSDWNSIGELIPHGVAKDSKQAAELAINAGLDMDMQAGAYLIHLQELVKEGKVSLATIDESVRRILKVKFQLGLFDNPYKYCDLEREKNTIRSKDIFAAALDVASKSIVLLKNDNNLLPFKKDLKKIAVIGPLADSKNEPLGAWAQQGDPNDVVTVVDGIKNKLSGAQIFFEQGCTISGTSKDGFAKAVTAANNADAVVLVLGEAQSMSGEAHSRADINLPGVQDDLAKEIFQTGKPVVVVLMNGRPLTINWISQNIPAIVESWFLGVQSGNAIADALFGDINPSGKLPVTFPRSVGQIPIYYNHKNTGRPYKPKAGFVSGYIDEEYSPLYPFGFGLSYTVFEYSNLLLSSSKIKNGESIIVSVDVKNSGLREGEEVVQLYIRDLVGSVTRPIKELKDFAKVNLKPGETKHVEFLLTPEKLKFYNIDMNEIVEPGEFKAFVGTNSVDVLETSFAIE